MLFSDECTMQQFVRRHMHMHEKYVVATMKHPPYQMISCVVSSFGAAGLHFIPPNTTTNGPMHVETAHVRGHLHAR